MANRYLGHDNYRETIRQDRNEEIDLANVGLKYTFENLFHPFVGELIAQLNRRGLRGLMDADYHASLDEDFFADAYKIIVDDAKVEVAYGKKEIDVSFSGPYANYNWELLFHLPLAIAVHLSKNQRFAESQRWFHYVFDPTGDQPFWKFIKFRNNEVPRIVALLTLLSKRSEELSESEGKQRREVEEGYEAIRNWPFQAHRVARTRSGPYQYNVLMKYLDNLIAWGDSLFIQDTVESINEAMQRYMLAANILGPRPQQIPTRGKTRARTFHELKQAGADIMGNALAELEAQFPFNLASSPPTSQTETAQSSPLFGIGRGLYFCIPHNDKLLTYWDTVADRVFKIRHCMNIEGVVRQLALFDPPVDPGLFVKAAAAGIDAGTFGILKKTAGPIRALTLMHKALELCSEVRALGSAYLSAIEKADGEHLALLRQGHEIKIQRLTLDVRFLQWKQAEQATEGLLRNRVSALERYTYYRRLLGLNGDASSPPELLPLDRRQLTEENFDEAFGALVGQYEKEFMREPYSLLRLAGKPSPEAQSGAKGTGQLNLNLHEDKELNTHSPKAQENRDWASRLEMTASTLASIPGFSIKMHFFGLGAAADIPLGTMLSNAARAVSSHFSNSAQSEDRAGQNASKTGSYERRSDDWRLQHNLAARELGQLGRQILSSLIGEQVARREYENLKRQIQQAEEVDRFLREKFTNKELYAWMRGELSRLYYEYYRFALEVARTSEQAMKQELMRPEVDAIDFIKLNHWNGGRQGLLAGESLYLNVKRMELAYHEYNKREYELTKHVSLRRLDPVALLSLKATGSCQFDLPEWAYDLNCPGHYMRRIRSVALSIPCVVGPYSSVNCTLILLRSSLRRKPDPGQQYERDLESDDDRFVDYRGAIQSVVTSTAQNDSGLFETNLRDERLLPFEGAGAIGTWRLELPSGFPQFDYATISDAVLHIRYSARADGALKNGALAYLATMLQQANNSSLAQLLSLRHDFPNEWGKFVTGAGDFSARLGMNWFPYFVQHEALSIDVFEIYTIKHVDLSPAKTVPVPPDMTEELKGPNKAANFTIPASVLDREATDAFLVVRYHLEG